MAAHSIALCTQKKELEIKSYPYQITSKQIVMTVSNYILKEWLPPIQQIFICIYYWLGNAQWLNLSHWSKNYSSRLGAEWMSSEATPNATREAASTTFVSTSIARNVDDWCLIRDERIQTHGHHWSPGKCWRRVMSSPKTKIGEMVVVGETIEANKRSLSHPWWRLMESKAQEIIINSWLDAAEYE